MRVMTIINQDKGANLKNKRKKCIKILKKQILWNKFFLLKQQIIWDGRSNSFTKEFDRYAKLQLYEKGIVYKSIFM